MCFLTERMNNWLFQSSSVIRISGLVGAAMSRGHIRRKLNDHVYSFLLLMSSKPHHQVELKYMESGVIGFKEKTKVPNRFPPPPTSPSLALRMQFNPRRSFFALQVDHETDSDISFSIPTTETECKGKYKRESFYVPDKASQESEGSSTDV